MRHLIAIGATETRSTLNLQRLDDQRELVRLPRRQIVELQVLDKVNAVDDEHDLMARARELRIRIRRHLDAAIIRSHEHRILLASHSAAATPMPGLLP